MTKKKEFTREDYEKGMQGPPFNYSGHMLKVAMESYDSGQEFKRIHPYKKPKDMKEVSFSGYSSDTIDDIIEIECECNNERFTIAGGYMSFCPKCGRGYRVISYIAQYEKKED